MFHIPTLGILLLMMSVTAAQHSSQPDVSDALSILNTGIFSLTPDAMGITFYIHLENNLPVYLDVATRMWECCENLEIGEVDCSHIHLMGGYKGMIPPGESRNITLFYPNLYVHNRMGECLVGIWYRDPKGNVSELKAKINFDTTLTPQKISPSIRAYYEDTAVKVKKCLYFDEDALDNCEPVDCSRKYNGQKLYFSTVEHRCLSVPIIKSVIRKNKTESAKKSNGLPRKVYQPESNSCEDIEPVVREEDVRTINTGRGADEDMHPSNGYDFIICHHGNKSVYTGHCFCKEGWMPSLNFIRPTTLKIHLCTIPHYLPKPSMNILNDIKEFAIWNCKCYGSFTKKNILIILVIIVLSIFCSNLFSQMYTYKDFLHEPAAVAVIVPDPSHEENDLSDHGINHWLKKVNSIVTKENSTHQLNSNKTVNLGEINRDGSKYFNNSALDNTYTPISSVSNFASTRATSNLLLDNCELSDYNRSIQHSDHVLNDEVAIMLEKILKKRKHRTRMKTKTPIRMSKIVLKYLKYLQQPSYSVTDTTSKKSFSGSGKISYENQPDLLKKEKSSSRSISISQAKFTTSTLPSSSSVFSLYETDLLQSSDDDNE